MSSTTFLPRAPAQVSTARWLPRLGVVAAVCGVAVTIAAIAARSAPLAVACAAALVGARAIPWFRGRTAWATFTLALGGSSVLGYGFANVQAFPSTPVPLVDVLVVATFVGLVLTGVHWPVPRIPFLLTALLFGWASIRLAVDYPTWGSFALRDYTTYVELSSLFIGYWLMVRVGMERWLRAMAWIFVLVVIYGLVQFDDGLFLTFNVLVGVQQPVALLGHVTGVASVSAFFFFALLRPFGSKSLLLAALAIAPLFLFQSRGLYLALPLTIVLLGLLRGRTPGVRRILAAAALAVVTAGIVLAIQPTGRFGSTSPALLREQLLTLVGGTGVGDGSLNARTQWLSGTINRVTDHPGGLIYGLGLGPDLTNGFSAQGSILVRKPHDDFLEMFARLGLVGLCIFVLLIGAALKALVDGSRRSAAPRERFFQQWVLANSFIYLFIAGTQPLLSYPYGTIPLFGILGAGLALRGREIRADATPRSASPARGRRRADAARASSA